ncbi:MAG: TonB-dependent receptor [Deltaproteobacteria bacterium]|nr:TonB-dependent receptor [Deltaproteobacteria bacterium]
MGVGSYNQNKEKVAFSGKARDLDISFGVTHDFRDDYKTGNGFIWKDSRYGNHTNANLDIGYTFLNNHRIDINYYYLDINGNLCPGMTGEVSYLNPVDPGNIDDFSRTDVSLSNAAFSYEGKTEDNLFNWSLTYGTGRNKESGTWATSIWDLDTLTSFVSYNGDLISSVLGLDYSKYVIKSDSWGELPISSMTDLGVFLTTKLHLLENNLIFSAGGRYDTYKNKYETGELSQHAFTPSIGVAYNPVEWLKLRANYSKGFKMPTPIEVFPQSSGSYTYLFNPGLRPEKSKTFEIGTDVYWSFITGSLTYFHSDWDDKITSVEVAPNMRQNVNLTNSEIAGLEFALSADLGQAFDQDFVLKPYVNLTYLTKRKNKDHTGGNQSVEYLGFDTLTNVARTIMNFGVNFHHPGINLKANINARKMWGMISQTWNNYDMGHGMGRNNSFYNYDNDFIVDLSLEKRLWDFEKFGHLNLKAQINNIFDAFYMPYINYPGPGRNFYVGLAWEY